MLLIYICTCTLERKKSFEIKLYSIICCLAFRVICVDRGYDVLLCVFSYNLALAADCTNGICLVDSFAIYPRLQALYEIHAAAS